MLASKQNETAFDQLKHDINHLKQTMESAALAATKDVEQAAKKFHTSLSAVESDTDQRIAKLEKSLTDDKLASDQTQKQIEKIMANQHEFKRQMDAHVSTVHSYSCSL